MFKWVDQIKDYIARNSKLYKEKVEESDKITNGLQDISKELNEDLEAERKLRLTIEQDKADLEDLLQERERELKDTELQLEIQRRKRKEKYNLVGLLKSTKSKLERKLQEYAPLEVTYQMIESSDQPCLYLTTDFIILKRNKASQKDKTFRNRHEGEDLLDSRLIEEGEIEELKKKAIMSKRPFEYQPKNFKSRNWSIIPIKENETIFGYILTKKGFLTRTLEKVQELYKEIVGPKESKRIITAASKYALQ